MALLELYDVNFEPQHDKTNNPAQQHLWCEVLDKPSQFDVFSTHQGQSADAANREQTASDSSRVGNNLPEGTIGGYIAHPNLIQRNVGNSDGERIDDS